MQTAPGDALGQARTDALAQAQTVAREQARALLGNAVESLPEGALADKLAIAAAEGRQLRVKLGIDPTAPDIHLGHAVVLRTLRAFQDLGHRVVLIVGDFTARVGDPSGRSTLRPVLAEQEIERNATTFQEQALKVLDGHPERLEVRRNGEWLAMPAGELLQLLRSATVAQLLEREDFAKRMLEQRPISLLELTYPLLQGYDSVAIEADVELGGTDQKFNLLLGRDLQRLAGMAEQAIVTMPILVGTDGVRKMSKSLRNHIGLTEPPEEIYGKTMSIPDSALREYFSLLLDAPPPSGLPPRDAKRLLARELVAWLHGREEAEAAERAFDRLFVERRAPEEVAEARLPDGDVHLPAVISDAFGISRSDARRLIDEGAVSLDRQRLGSGAYDLPARELDGRLLRVGRRRFRRLRAS
ncbi:MAG: tyrosine--tRNA ligase [Acidimicrobiales bacterium]